MPEISLNLPSGSTALALAPLALLLLGLVTYALIRLARAERAPYLPTWAWALIIVLAVPWGAVAYLLLARGGRTADPDEVAAASPSAVVAVSTPAMAPPRDGAAPLVSTHRLTRDYGGGAGLFGVDLRVPRGWSTAWWGRTARARARCCRS